MSQFSPGQIISDKFRVLSVLGQGAMGTVYAVEHLLLRVPVALKVLAPHLASRPEHVERFLREGAAVSRVRHRAVVQVLDAGTHCHQPWIAMELLEGDTLRGRMARAGMSAAEVLPILIEVVHGLAASHEQGIVHRDVKPANIVLARQTDGSVQPKLLDFGIALVVDAQERLTGAGMMMGTLHYMAPEQVHAARDADARADLYSVGAILFEILTGRPPYPATSVTELVAAFATQPVPDLLAIAPYQPKVLADIVGRCLARDREARPRDARQLAAMLDAAVRFADQAGPLPSTLIVPGIEASRPGATPSPAYIDPRGPTAHGAGVHGHSPAPHPSAHGAQVSHGGTVALAPDWQSPMQAGSYPGGGWQPAATPASWPDGSGASWPGGGSPPSPQALWPAEDPFSRPPRRSGLWHLAWVMPLGLVLAVGAAFGVVTFLDGDDEPPRATAAVAASESSTPPLSVAPATHAPSGMMLPVQPGQPAQPAQQLPPGQQLAPTAVTPTPSPVFPTSPTPNLPPRVAPAPVPTRGHPCIGEWQGTLLQSDGQRASGVVNIQGNSGQCGGFVERWTSGSTCNYRLSGCATEGNVLTASARAPSHQQCSPARMRFTCEQGRLRFFESAAGVTVTSQMSRR